MQEMGEDRWVKPYDGYFDPDPNCSKCAGKGYKEVTVIFGEGAKEVFIGICTICGEENGIRFVYPDLNEDEDHCERNRPNCLNKECTNYKQPIQWVEVGAMEI